MWRMPFYGQSAVLILFAFASVFVPKSLYDLGQDCPTPAEIEEIMQAAARKDQPNELPQDVEDATADGGNSLSSIRESQAVADSGRGGGGEGSGRRGRGGAHCVRRRGCACD